MFVLHHSVNMSFIDNPVYVLTILGLMVLCPLWSAKAKWDKLLGPMLLVIVFIVVLSNLKLIPSACKCNTLIALGRPKL